MTGLPPFKNALRIAGGFALLFGALTVVSGGFVLFGGQTAMQLAGDAVRFVVWFNFLAGAAYMAAGIGMLRRKRWACWLALAILASTVAVICAFAVHVILGHAYETRTWLALTFRAALWAVNSWIAWKALRKARPAC
ncbi:hypothetical protein [Roseibium aggregatum]|uniref:Uncharacterized protein n=1 Tax=Roseibium aggregatum TaxID=187304 RepID=A0A939EGC0_9HYPH|nr:hypothetical protein [Roseibium aggregatum]MBN9672706.1 hypothetical protein [Roseibium aggregatum]